MRKSFALTLLILGLVGLPGLVAAQSFEPDQPREADPDRSQEVDGDSVTFDEGARPSVGDRIDSQHGTVFKAKTSVAMEGTVLHESEVEQAETGHNTIEILAIDDDGEITAMRISVHENSSRSVEDGREQETESDTVGRVYHLTHNGDDWDVNYCETDEQAEEGDQVGRFEAIEVSEIAEGSTDNHLRDSLAGNTYEVGDEVELDMDEFLGQDEDEMGLDTREFTVTFAGLTESNGRRAAKFDVTMNMSGEIGPGMTMSIETSGEMIVDIETMIALSMDLEGPIRIKGGDEMMQIDGTGTFEMTARASIARSN